MHACLVCTCIQLVYIICASIVGRLTIPFIVLYVIISTVQLSLDYPNTWCPHLIRMAEIFGYHNAHGTIHIPAHARVEVTMSMSIIKNAVSTIWIIEG